jgi:hypothetical protein
MRTILPQNNHEKTAWNLLHPVAVNENDEAWRPVQKKEPQMDTD